MLRIVCYFFFSSRRRHTRCALVTGVQTCALPIYRLQPPGRAPVRPSAPPESGSFQARPCPFIPIHRRKEATIAFTVSICAPDTSCDPQIADRWARCLRSEEHTSELQSLMRSSSAVFCSKHKTQVTHDQLTTQ